MELFLSRDNINALIKRLDFELVTRLHEQLSTHIEFELVVQRKLGTGIIFAAQTDRHRIELLTAYVPITARTSAGCSVSTSRVKYLCTRYVRDTRHDQWLRDLTFGDGGFEAFCLATIDDDSVETMAIVIADHTRHHLSPLYA
ncbi:hypothetical protein LPN04_29495 [Rugamonas sp. A1-17]|nr:hypothetical protein [Rugamonas sp. A1-17]